MTRSWSRFILRVRVPEAPGLSGAGSRVPSSNPPRSDSHLRLALPPTIPIDTEDEK